MVIDKMRWTVLCLVVVSLANHGAAQQTLRAINFFTNIGGTVDINLSNIGTGTCRLKQPNGLEADLTSLNWVGVTVHPTSKFVACRVTIGPMTQALLGNWELSHTSGVTTRVQPATIAWADTANPSATPRQRVLSGEQHYKAAMGSLVIGNLRQESGQFEGCFVTAPDGTTMPLSEETDYPGVELYFRTNSENRCYVQLGPVDADIIGKWNLFAWFVHNGVKIEAQQPINVHEEDGIERLPVLEYLTHTGATYDISLNKTVNVATCSLIDPAGTQHTLTATSDIPGVTVFNADSYVICRVSIGPMEESLLGEWTLIQHNTDNTQRRQHVVFQWANPSHPDEESWFVVHDIPRQIFATTGSSSNIFISRNQEAFETCFITTPSGLHLPMYGRNYPGVQHVLSDRMSSCIIQLGPLNAEMWGDWTLHARHNVEGRLIEYAQVFHITQDTGIRTLQPMRQWTHLGAIVDINLNHTGVSSTCRLQAPSGIEYGLTPGTTPVAGVTVYSSTKYVSCRVTVGPITANHIGEWVLIEQGTTQQRRQPVIIQFSHGITYLPPLTLQTHNGGSVDINLSQNGSIGTCMLRNPAGQVFVLDSTFNAAGITVHSSSKFVSCRVTIGPMSNTLLGDWTLMHQVAGQRERRVEASVIWANPMDPSWSYQVISAPDQHVTGTFGETISLILPWHPGMHMGCVVIAPDGTVMPHTEYHDYPGIVWSRVNSVASCTAILGPLDDSMLGKWTLAGRFDIIDSQVESQQSVVLTRNTANEMELPQLEYLTYAGAMVDLSLDNINKQIQSCTLLTPDLEYHVLGEDTNVTGVEVQGSSKFVSCRVTIGPMSEELLGTWTLVENDVDGTHRRQAAAISWANPTNPDAEPRLKIESQLELRADTGEIRQVFLPREEAGFFEGCYITTPDGTVLPLFPHMHYPGIAHAGLNRLTACFVDLGPMDKDMVGEWILAARYNNAGNRVEAQLPINFLLVDGMHIQPPIHELTYFGGFVDLNLNQTGVGGGCSLTTPSGEEHVLGSLSSIPGVAIHSASKFVACRVVIGPMTEALLGDWVISHMGSDNTDRHQPMTIAWENPSNPSAQRQVTTQAQQTYTVPFGTIVSTSVSREEGVFEGCFLTTPDGSVLPITQNNAYPGAIWAAVNRITACFVQIGPIDAEEQGNWVLTAKSNNYGVRTELRVPVQITLQQQQPTHTENLPRREVFTHVGGFVDVAFNDTGSSSGPCRLQNPAGQTYLLQNSVMLTGVDVRDSNQFVSCIVRIGPMTQELLGTWTLIQPDTTTTERTQPVQISWAHPASPQDPMTVVRLPVDDVVLEENDVYTIVGRRYFNDTFFEGCFITTPDSTTLPILYDNRYPGIVNAGANRLVSCFVDIGPITSELAGQWVLATVVNRAGERIIAETPTHITISDGVVRLPAYQHFAFEGHYIDLSMNQTGNTGNCLLKVPAGHEYTLAAANSLDGVTAHEQNRYVSCRVVIGPITETHIGEWVLIQQFNDPHLRTQSATIAWANPSDTAAEVWDIRTEPEIEVYGDYGATIQVSMARSSLNILFEGCFITTPDGMTLPIFPSNSYPGIRHVGVNQITSCFVELGPIDTEMAGTWMLAARFNDNGVRHENRRPYVLAIGSPPATFNATALIVSLTVIFGIVLVVGGFLAYKPTREWGTNKWSSSRDWSTNRWHRLRSSMRSMNTPIYNDHELGSRSSTA